MSKRTSTHNKATFLMDGEEFFGTFASCLDEVKRSVTKGVVPPKTYVRLAYWAMEKELPLSSTETQLTLEDALKELADLGVHVEIILWDPDLLSGNVGGDKNFATKVAHGNQAVHKALHNYKEKILVYLESHPKPGVGFGLHQKMSIFSVDGKHVTSNKEVPGALHDAAYAEKARVKLVPRTPGQLGAGSGEVEKRLPHVMNYSWF